MKFNLIVAIAVLLTAGTASAQVNFGIKGGLNLYTLGGDNNDAADIKAGFHLGVLGHIHMSPHFALQPEVVFSTQGAKSESNDDKLDLNYVNVPLMFQYMFDNGFRLEAGPQLGFLTSAKFEGEDVKDNLNDVDFGIGLGASYINPASGFGVDARYNHGLTNINENDVVDSFNRGFQLGVFYQFSHN